MSVSRLPTSVILAACCVAWSNLATGGPLSDLDLQAPTQVEPTDKPAGAPDLDPYGLDRETGGGSDTAQSALDAAAAAFARSKFDDCLEYLKTAVARSPKLPSPHVLLAEFFLQKGDTVSARESLRKAPRTESHPQHYLTSGKVALSEGRLNEAQQHFEMLGTIPPPSTWTTGQVVQMRAATYSGLANVAERRGDWQLAASHLQRWLKLQPDRSELRDRLGAALLMAGKENEAREQFEVSYRKDNKRNHPDVSIAAVYLQNGHFAKANAAIAYGLSEHPDDGPLHFAASMALLYQDKFTDADRHADAAQSNGQRTAKLWLLRSRVAWALGDYDRAAAYAAQVLRDAEDNPDARYCYVVALAAQNDQQKRRAALALAEAFLREQPRSPVAMVSVGTAQFHLGANQLAEKHFQPVVNHPSMPPEPQFYYGQALANNGKLKDAKFIARRLQARISQPGVFLNRPAAMAWTEEILKAE